MVVVVELFKKERLFLRHPVHDLLERCPNLADSAQVHTGLEVFLEEHMDSALLHVNEALVQKSLESLSSETSVSNKIFD